MSEASDFDFPCSRTFRDGLGSPNTIDYRTSRTFSGPLRRPSRPSPQFRDQELDDLEQQILGWRATALYWQERARRAEEDPRSKRIVRRDPPSPITFEGPEVPVG